MDKYSDFNQLESSERGGVDYEIVNYQRNGTQVAIIAPHGGGIEPMTDIIAECIAGNEFSLYCFKGCKKSRNSDLHITSCNFDEPKCTELIKGHRWVVAIHGCSEKEEKVFLGGLDKELIGFLADALAEAGVSVKKQGHKYPATSTKNICNRGASKAGVQFELTLPFRKGPRRTQFVTTVRKVLLDCQGHGIWDR